ncbi:MAG: 4Fe-4S dicluster domain-containing protein [Rhodocyclaceae bacterium]
MISRREFLRGRFSRDGSEDIATSNGACATKIAVIGPACIAYAQNTVCRSCGDACDAAAIRFSPRLGGAALPVVLAERCTGCGACLPVCPAGAITLTPAGPR